MNELVITLGAVICIITIDMIRRDLLRTAYALLWLLSGVVVIFIGVFPGSLQLLVHTGMVYQTAMLFIVFAFMLVLMMQYSIIISRISNRNKHLAQDLAILREEMRRLTASSPAPSPRPSADRESPET